MPLEYYPPVINLLNTISEKDDRGSFIYVYSTSNVKGRNEYTNDNILIKRSSFPEDKEPRLLRLFKYLSFNIQTLLSLIKFSPNSVLYYESYSAWPVYWYIKVFNPKCQVLIHFHEYSPPSWYETGMTTVKTYHKYEVEFLFKKAIWISQTNQDRLSLFSKDYPFIDENVLRVIPNYPPRNWKKGKIKNFSSPPVRCVYIGSLSLGSTYLAEFCEWLDYLQGAIQLDIYAYNLDAETVEFLIKRNSPYLKFYDKGIEYDNIPSLLNNYSVGIIFYKPSTLNVLYSAPNKLFEYQACGLDVWFPEEIIGCMSFITSDVYPKVLSLDFNNLKINSVEELVDRTSLLHGQREYSAENENAALVNLLYCS